MFLKFSRSKIVSSDLVNTLTENDFILPKCYSVFSRLFSKKGLIEQKRMKAQFKEKSALKAHWSVSLSYP